MSQGNPDYLRSFRVVEISAVAAFAALAAWLGAVVGQGAEGRELLLFFAGLLGWVSADLASGLVHWAADTWGTVDWPIIGKTLIRSFREHHHDPLAITRHDFIEVNGANCLISLPVLAFGLWLNRGGASSIAAHFSGMWLLSLTCWVFATNQIHCWAHRERNPGWVRALQGLGLILSPEEHDRHHVAPFLGHYCITTGWLNGPLESVSFFRRFERLVTAVTGARPRADARVRAMPALPERIAPVPPPFNHAPTA